MVDTSSYPADTSLGAALETDHSFATDHPHLPATSNEGSLGGLSLGIPQDTTEFIGELFDPDSEIVIPNDDGVSSTAPEPSGAATFHSGGEVGEHPPAQPSSEARPSTRIASSTIEEVPGEIQLSTRDEDASQKRCSCMQTPCMCDSAFPDSKDSIAGLAQGKLTGSTREDGQPQADQAVPAGAGATPSHDFQASMPASNTGTGDAMLSSQLIGEDLHGMWSADHPGAPYGGDEGELIPNPLGRFDDVNGWDTENIQLDTYSSTDTSCGLDGGGNRADGEADAEVEGTERENDSGEAPVEENQKQKASKSKPIVQVGPRFRDRRTALAKCEWVHVRAVHGVRVWQELYASACISKYCIVANLCAGCFDLICLDALAHRA